MSNPQEILEVLEKARSSGDSTDRDKLDLRNAQLDGADLRGTDLSELDLSGAQLNRADLRDANLARCCLVNASLRGANLSNCEFLGADLSHADLAECDAERVGLASTNLSGSILFHIRAVGASFSGATLSRADLRSACLTGARLRGADLRDANLSGSDLRGAEFREANVAGARFLSADLREASMQSLTGHESATWVRADIRQVDFRGAYRVRRFIKDQNYLDEFRLQSWRYAVLYWLWWITSDCGRSLLRWSVWVLVTALFFGAIYPLVDLDYGEHATSLSPYYFSFVTLTTLGYGDVVPASVAAQVVAMCEVAIGYTALGGLLAILANKMARRAD